MHIPTPSDVTRRLTALIPASGRRHRRVWVGNGRAHIELRGHGALDGDRVHEALQSVFDGVQGINWAVWNAAIARVIVAFDGEGLDANALVTLLEEAERRLGLDGEEFPLEARPHPGDRESIQRLVVEMGADVAAFGASISGAWLRWTPLPVELASVVGFLETQKPVRETIARFIGPRTPVSHWRTRRHRDSPKDRSASSTT